jgi:serine/threonine-protein phosphatase 2A activator
MNNYLNDCYGDNMRIDYGTGHELNFMIFLYCLDKLGVLKEVKDRDIV